MLKFRKNRKKSNQKSETKGKRTKTENRNRKKETESKNEEPANLKNESVQVLFLL